MCIDHSMKAKNLFLRNLLQLESPEGFHWELINESHTEDIIRWRNDPDNLKLFEEQKSLTEEDQRDFLSRYSFFDRVDLVLCNKCEPVGVFNLKNLSDKAEFGALIGNKKYRGQGIGLAAKFCLLRFWFNVLGKEEMYTKNRLINDRILASNLKLGFKEIGRDENQMILVLSKKDFLKRDLK